MGALLWAAAGPAAATATSAAPTHHVALLGVRIVYLPASGPRVGLMTNGFVTFRSGPDFAFGESSLSRRMICQGGNIDGCPSTTTSRRRYARRSSSALGSAATDASSPAERISWSRSIEIG